MNREQLVELLRHIALAVENGDSMEGNIEYHFPDEEMAALDEWPTADTEFWVHGVIRTGNLLGQGGVQIIGDIPRGETTHDSQRLNGEQNGQYRH